MEPIVRDRDDHGALIVATVLAMVLVSFVAILFLERNFIFDDSFISYRYARNLAHGDGLVWNPGSPPVEGYTNFLLVVALAPFLLFGLDPLTVTRIASLFAGFGIAALTGRLARREYGFNRATAWLVGLAFLPVGQTYWLSSVGLETVVFTFVLFAAFYLSLPLLQGAGTPGDAAACGATAFAALLLRPEALLLVMLLSVAAAWAQRRNPRRLARLIAAGGATFAVPLAIYLGWKQAYFGSVIPTAAFLKMTPEGLVSQRGVRTVTGYLQLEWVLVILALGSFALRAQLHRARTLALIFSLAYLAFYLRVETLMDLYYRFVYPVTPFLYFLALPLAGWIFKKLLGWRVGLVPKVAAVLATVGLVFTVQPLETARGVFHGLRGEDANADPLHLMQREYRLAHDLRNYPRIESITIAWGDAGVIPYFTEARSLDYVGLNDRFIATHTDLDLLVDYFFEQQPTLIVQTTLEDFSRRRFLERPGHGHFATRLWEWITDPRWDEYPYVGTVRVYGKLLHLHLWRDYADFDRLSTFLQEVACDEVLDPVPFEFGSYRPPEPSR